MLLTQNENRYSIRDLCKSGLAWVSLGYLIYLIISISIQYIVPTNPLTQNICMSRKERFFFKFIFSYIACLDFWVSGLVSRPIPNQLTPANPQVSTDIEKLWVSDKGRDDSCL